MNFIYVIAGVLICIPVIAAFIMPMIIKRDRNRIRKEIFYERTAGVPQEEWSHKLIGFEEEVERRFKELYPNVV
jgi:hypothetical protein